MHDQIGSSTMKTNKVTFAALAAISVVLVATAAITSPLSAFAAIASERQPISPVQTPEVILQEDSSQRVDVQDKHKLL